MLFVSAYWHGLGKLRMHTDSSLQVLDIITIAFGQKLRDFAEETCKNLIQWRQTRSTRHGREQKRDVRVIVVETETKNRELAQGSAAAIST